MSAWVGIGRSDIGLIRTSNQDALLTLDHAGLWAVADGMGGHAGGEIAAQTALTSVKSRAEVFSGPVHQGHSTPADYLTDLVVQAHEAILGRAKVEPKLKGMGTTIVLLCIVSTPAPIAHVAHVGDSRAYRFRAGVLTPLTRDHTLIERYLERGILTKAAARTHPERHVLTRGLGMPGTVKPDVAAFPLDSNDMLLLCSDGLTKMLEDQDIEALLAQAKGDPIRACDALIGEALKRGGEDNVTVIVVAHP